MGTKDPRIDAYVAAAAPFARPVLRRLRRLLHTGCPTVVESLKWGHPSFAHHGILAGMAAFREHAAFGFWKHDAIVVPGARAKEAMGSFGRLRTVADLPSDAAILRMVRTAAELNERGVKVPRTKTGPRPAIPTPPELAAALARHAKARATFAAFSPSARREYAEWVAEAKRSATKARRVATSIEQLAAGKRLGWRYA